MRPGRYAAGDGSFAKSAGGAGARGLALLALALLIGIVLLNATDADPPGTTVSSNSSSDNRNAAADDAGGTATTTSVAPTTTVPAHAAKDVKVIIANASTVKGAAGNAKKALDPAGYNILAPANAAAAPATSVYFTPGYDRDAAAVAAALALPGSTVKAIPAPPPFDTKGANVAVVIGADQASKFAAAPAAGATTTTVPGATTTVAGAAATTTTKKP